MGALSDYYDLKNIRNTGALLIKNSQDLQAQLTTAKADVSTLSAKIKNQAQLSNFVTDDIIKFGQALTLQAGVISKLTGIKTSLDSIKNQMQDLSMTQEVNDEINAIDNALV